MKISVVVPVYNGENILKDLYTKISDALTELCIFEVLFICDKCDIRSGSIVRELKKEHPGNIKVYSLAKNYGQHRALLFGFGKAEGDFVITIDEDLQHDPADILKLVKKQAEQNYDIVYARFNDLQHEGIRNNLSLMLRKILKHFIPTLYDNYSPFRLIKRDIAVSVSTLVSPYTFVDDFLSRITQNTAFTDLTHYKRREGKSSYTFLKLVKHGVYILLAYSRIILWLLIIAGLFVSAGAVMFVLSILNSSVPSISLLSNISILSVISVGVLFISLSFLGTYINHKNFLINNRPVKLLYEDTI